MNIARCAVIVMAKAPDPGAVKTRLIPALGAEGAAALAARLLKHTLAQACAAHVGPVILAGAPGVDHPFLRFCAMRYGASLVAQPDGDLGARMHTLLSGALAEHACALVIGSDCPLLCASRLREAAEHLTGGADVVLAPTEDGGYALIGLRRSQAVLFADIAWSTPSVLAQTRERIAACGLRAAELPVLWDVDRPEDVARLAREAPAGWGSTG
ncbi:MAG: TIGR04282 family arsenosugar biosynthesis glycosyltransferase [Burkholderiales bacterium]